MKIKPVENTREIPGALFIGVQSKTDADAETLLQAIAARHGVTVEIIYRFGQSAHKYYYAPLPARDGGPE